MMRRSFLVLLMMMSDAAVMATSTLQSAIQPCPSGSRMTYMLVTNTRPTAVSYQARLASNMTACAELCDLDVRCRALAFNQQAEEFQCWLLDKELGLTELGLGVRSKLGEEGFFYMQKTCLKGACDKLFSHELVLGVELDPADGRLVSNVSQSGCLERCFAETSLPCRSVQFYPTTGDCRLNRYDRFARHAQPLQPISPDVLYFDTNCAHEPVSGRVAAQLSLLQAGLEHPFSLVKLQNVTLTECGELCLRWADFPCRSFLYSQGGEDILHHTCSLSHLDRSALLHYPAAPLSNPNTSFYEAARALHACDADDMQFEAIYGHSSDVPPYKVHRDTDQTVCLTECRSDVRCQAVSVDHRRRACSLIEDEGQRVPTRHFNQQRRDRLPDEPVLSLFRKICLHGKARCERDWAFQRFPGRELRGAVVSQRLRTVDAEGCLSACLSQTSFTCRSAQYNPATRDCTLSEHDRYSNPADKSFHLATGDDDQDYYESNCHSEPRSFCSSKVTYGVKLLTSDRSVEADDLNQCRATCFSTTELLCRAFTFHAKNRTCDLHHNTKSTAPVEAIVIEPDSELHEPTSCFDVSVDCHESTMEVRIKSSAIFDGKVYVKGRPECVVDVTRSTAFTLPIPLQQEDCGTSKDNEGSYTNAIVIQSNDHILTTTDRLIGVHCQYELANRTHSSVLNVSGPPQAMADSRGQSKPPEVRLRVLDMEGEEKTSFILGERIRVQIVADDESSYGLFVRNMVATDGDGSFNVTLIDARGCPSELRMVREMRRVDSTGKVLESVMEAFAFPGSNVINLLTDVTTCLQDSCRPVSCNSPSLRSWEPDENIQSYGRRRRRAVDSSATAHIATTLSIQTKQFGLEKPRKLPALLLAEDTPSSPRVVIEESVVEFAERDHVCLNQFVVLAGGAGFMFLQGLTVAVCLALICHWTNTRKRYVSAVFDDDTDSYWSRSSSVLQSANYVSRNTQRQRF